MGGFCCLSSFIEWFLLSFSSAREAHHRGGPPLLQHGHPQLPRLRWQRGGGAVRGQLHQEVRGGIVRAEGVLRDGRYEMASCALLKLSKIYVFFLFKTSISTLRRSLPPTSAPSRPSSTPTGSPQSPRPSPPTPRRATSSSWTSASTSPSRRALTPQGARSSTLGTTTVRTCSSCWSSRPLRTRR